VPYPSTSTSTFVEAQGESVREAESGVPLATNLSSCSPVW
jgi:hypothetical protein